MKTGYKVADCMTIRPVTVEKGVSLSEGAVMMKDKHVGSLLVMEAGKLLGLVTEQDLVRKALAERKDPAKTSLEEVMHSELISITPDKDIYDALKVMRDYNIRHLPVMERGGLVGFLTIKDVLKIQPQLFDIIVEKFEIREPSRKPLIGSSSEDISLCEECKNYSEDLQETDGLFLCASCRGEDEEE
ncbi:CBS domain-containing protein [Candidatus Woesearchaeota archaeon]|nr:CBS domain-containing protein [Candidatus Woesearchaeota archaeon]